MSLRMPLRMVKEQERRRDIARQGRADGGQNMDRSGTEEGQRRRRDRRDRRFTGSEEWVVGEGHGGRRRARPGALRAMDLTSCFYVSGEAISDVVR